MAIPFKATIQGDHIQTDTIIGIPHPFDESNLQYHSMTGKSLRFEVHGVWALFNSDDWDYEKEQAKDEAEPEEANAIRQLSAYEEAQSTIRDIINTDNWVANQLINKTVRVKYTGKGPFGYSIEHTDVVTITQIQVQGNSILCHCAPNQPTWVLGTANNQVGAAYIDQTIIYIPNLIPSGAVEKTPDILYISADEIHLQCASASSNIGEIVLSSTGFQINTINPNLPVTINGKAILTKD